MISKPEPQFLTDWERRDYEREQLGFPPLGPMGHRVGNKSLIREKRMAEDDKNSNDNTNTDLLPPLPADELKNAIAFDNLARVVVTQGRIYARHKDGGWFEIRIPH